MPNEAFHEHSIFPSILKVQGKLSILEIQLHMPTWSLFGCETAVS